MGLACQPPPKAEGETKNAAKDGDKKEADKNESGRPVQPSGTGPVAKVNGDPIARDKFDAQMERTRARFQRAGREIAPALEKRLKENLIRKLVDEKLIAQKAKAEGVSVTQAEVDKKFGEHKGRFGNDKAFAAFLERTKQSEDDVRRDLKKNLLRDKLFDKLMEGDAVTEKDAQEYFTANKDKYKQREQVRASHILFKVSKSATPAEKKAQLAKAKDVLKLAKKKNADFAKLASEHSEGPTKSRGGDLGKFSRGRMVKAFEEAAFGAKEGAVVGPVETQFGYHIIKVFEKTAARQREFDEVKDSILTSLKARKKSKATRTILATLKKDAKVEVLEPGISLDAKKKSPLGVGGAPLKAGRNLEQLKAQAKKAAEKAHRSSTAKRAQEKATK